MRLLLALLFVAPVLRAEARPTERWEPVAKPWDRSLGSHRVVLKAGELPVGTKAVAPHMEWRRPDREPEKKAVLVYDLQSGKQVMNVQVESVTNVAGKITFEPTSGAGEYAVYFLAAKIEGGAFPAGKYTPPQRTAAEAWVKEASALKDRPQAEVARWEAISVQDAWTEMEIIGTAAADPKNTNSWELPGMISPFVRVESAEHSVRMMHAIPQRWLDSPAGPVLKARPGQYLTFQIVAYPGALRREDLPAGQDDPAASIAGLSFSDLAGPGLTIKADEITCFHLDKVDWQGRRYRVVSLQAEYGRLQPLWCGVQIPPSATAGRCSGKATVKFPNRAEISVPVVIEVAGEPVKDHGDADPQSLSRLRWLNSTTAVDDEPVKGYEPLTVNGRTIRCLGRELELGEDGLPVQIRSYFNKAVTKVMEKPQVEMLGGPVTFEIVTRGQRLPLPGTKVLPGTDLKWSYEPGGFRFTEQKPGAVEWRSLWTNEKAKLTLHGRMEFDGSVRYRMALEAAGKPVEFEGAGVLLPLRNTSLFMGLQQESGMNAIRKFQENPTGSEPELEWKWDTANKHQDSFWTGAVNAGLRLQLKSDNYVRPSVNIHYKRRPLNDPPSWNAAHAGRIFPLVGHGSGDIYAYAAVSGPFLLNPGKPLHFDFDLLITPFHTLRTQEQWSERYYHTGGVPQDYQKYLDSAKAAGANIVNIHQGNWLNPYINYPFLTADKLGAFAKAAHDRGMRAKYYYTVRELSNWCPELFAFRSMGDEILMSGKGGGHPWGEEHLGGNYWGAWYEPGVQDVSYLTQPMSRLHNYYVEGLRWLCENAGCDGIYLDDISYDRAIMLRARKVLDRYCPRGGRIDLHSWNEFHEGGAWAHCANIFMDSMPFVDRLWFGEGHHYTGPPPEHFLVELSGIPFGLMGEMLEGGGNPWFGLVHGMTGRLGWQGDPRAVWKLWDDFGVQDAEFIGWWAEEECPVRCADPLVKATVWKKNDATLVAVANFSKEPKQAALTIDWKALGRDPAKAKLYAVPIAQLKQRAALLAPDMPVLLKPYAGAVFILDEKPHDIAATAAAEALGAVILEDDFTKGLAAEWKPVISPRAKDAGKLDAGYVLQMPANLHAYLERALSAEAGAVSARIWQDGKDEAQQWGPGLALIWPDGKTLRANIRKDGRLTVSANGSENLDASITARAPVEFTIRWDKDTVKIIAAGPAMGDLPEEIASFPRAQFPGQPSILRVGKMPHSAGPQDHGDAGPTGFNRIEWIRVHGPK